MDSRATVAAAMGTAAGAELGSRGAPGTAAAGDTGARFNREYCT